MDTFQDQNVEQDPAAEFLAREQDELAGLEDDNFGEPQAAKGQDDIFGAETANDQVQAGGEADFFGGAPAEDPVPSYTGQEFDAFESDGGMQGDAIPGLDDLDQRLDEEEQAVPDAYGAIRSHDTIRAEPEKIRRWREEQKEMLEKKDAEGLEKMAEMREIAKKEIEDWYKRRDEQVEKTKENNRLAEQETQQTEAAPGTEWEKLARQCEFNPKNNRCTKDVSRMRSILLQLKQTPLAR